jgi:hypothetical protein
VNARAPLLGLLRVASGFTAALIGSSALVSAGPLAQPPAQAPSPAAALTGGWTLNRDLSDAPQDDRQNENEGGRGGYGRGGRGGGGFGRGGGMRGGMGRGGYGGGGATMSPEDRERLSQALHDIMTPPDRLTIVQADNMIVITTGDGRVTRLSPDGKKIKDESTKIERKTRWDGAKLVSEISGAVPSKITETYAADAEHHQLIVTVSMDRARNGQTVSQRRVYDTDTR